MTTTELMTLSMTELKAICASHAIDPVGDKRSKQTWVNAIVTFYSSQAVVTTPLTSPDPFKIEKLPVLDVPAAQLLFPTPQPPTSTTHRQASIVALIILVFFSTVFLISKGGFTLLTWTIAVIVPVLVSWWRYPIAKPSTTIIDYIIAPA
jgi:hypothetical protein